MSNKFRIGQMVYIDPIAFEEYAPAGIYGNSEWHINTRYCATHNKPCVVLDTSGTSLRIRIPDGRVYTHCKSVFTNVKNDGKIRFSYIVSDSPPECNGFSQWSKRYGH